MLLAWALCHEALLLKFYRSVCVMNRTAKAKEGLRFPTAGGAPELRADPGRKGPSGQVRKKAKADTLVATGWASAIWRHQAVSNKRLRSRRNLPRKKSHWANRSEAMIRPLQILWRALPRLGRTGNTASRLTTPRLRPSRD